MFNKIMLGSLGLAVALSAQALTPRQASMEVPQRQAGPDIQKAEKFTAARVLKSSAKAADDDWQVIGEGSMTDFVVGDLFWTSSKTFPVTIEQSKSDPNTYRIPEPYANWSDPAIKQYVKYDASKATPMVIHIYNGVYAWFEEFDTGLDVDLSVAGFPDKGELTVKMWGADFIEEKGIQLVAAEGPSALCGVTDGILSLSAFGSFQGESHHNVLCDIGGKFAAAGNYYVANYNGEFRITLPSTGEDAEWKYLGTGSMTECIFSGMFGLAPRIVNVEVERSVINPSLYRIKAPYAAWYDPQLADICTYEESVATPMIIHVEEGQYAWFESFNTGVYLNYTGSGAVLRGDVSVTQQGEQMVTQYGFINVANYWPESLCTYSDGVLTLGKTFDIDGQAFSTLTISVGNDGDLYAGNSYGNFRIELPINGNNDDKDWETIGMAEYTDDLMTMFSENGSVPSQTWKVEMQQYKKDPTMYRLVNPYAGWVSPFSDVSFDDSQDYHMVIYTLPKLGLACIGDFETGIAFPGLGMMGITTDAYYYAFSYGIDFTADVMPELFAKFNGENVSYPAYIMLEGDRVPSMLAWFGTYDDESLYMTNRSGKFNIKFPDESGIKSVVDSLDSASEYYNLSGIRIDNPAPGQIVIEKKNNTVRKITVR